MIEIGSTVKVHYRATLESGIEFDSTYRTGKPLEVVVGNHQLCVGVEKALLNMDVGETKAVSLPPSEAYGEWSPELVEQIPADAFPNADKLPVGGRIEIRTRTGIVRSKVESIENGVITFDHNHELAGKPVVFEITLVEHVIDSAIDRETHAAGCACGCHKLKESLEAQRHHHG